MALADLPDGFVTFTRDEIEKRYKRDYLLRNPEADVVSGQPDLDAKLAADLVLPFYFDAELIADGINEDAARGPRLDLVGARIGRSRGAASGATGYVAVAASAGGGTMQTGDEIENTHTRKKYEAVETKHVDDGEHIKIRAKSKGPETDVEPGAVLRWTSPRPGIGQNATVVEQSDGRGLTGGAEAEGDPRYLDGIREDKQNPANGDNDAELAKVIRKTPDVPVEQVFTYPGIYAGGSSGFTFTVLAPALGASRLPTDLQVQAAWEWIVAQMPGDNSYFPLVPTSQALVLAFAVTWAQGGWADVGPWPAAYADAMVISSASSAAAFIVSGSGTAPVVGNTVGIWDRNTYTLRRKTIATVTGTGPWTITCTTANGASDTSYTPQAGQRLSPWSDNLPAVPAPVLAYMATLGPGELFDPTGIPSEEGRRRLRSPAPPKEWPHDTDGELTVNVQALAEVKSATALAGVGTAVTNSLPPKLLELSDLALYVS